MNSNASAVVKRKVNFYITTQQTAQEFEKNHSAMYEYKYNTE